MTSNPEALYEALAQHLDTVGEDNALLFLAKAALALAHALDDTDAALAILTDCTQDLEG